MSYINHHFTRQTVRSAAQPANYRGSESSFNCWPTIVLFHHLQRDQRGNVGKQFGGERQDRGLSEEMARRREELQEQLRRAYAERLAQAAGQNKN